MRDWLRSRYGSYSIFMAVLVVALAAVAFLPNWSGRNADARNEAGTFWKTDLQSRGERLYAQNCATCHGWSGEGIEEVFPPLDGSRVVNSVETSTIMMVLYGRGAMPGFNHILDNDELAAVVSYTRTNWGNRAGPVSPTMVRQLRVEAFEPEH